MLEIFDLYQEQILAGLFVTIRLSVLAILISLAGGTLVGIARAYGGRTVRMILGVPVDVLRSVPLLVVLVWIYLASPTVVGIAYMDPFVAAVLGLSLVQGAYVSEIVRGGLQSVGPGQLKAGWAMGLTPPQVLRHVVLPQAMIRMLPPIGSQVLITLKDSTLASVIATPELLRTGQVIVGQTFKPFPIFTALLLFFLVAGSLLARVIDAIYKQVAIRGSS